MDTSKRLIAAKCLGLLAGYHARWQESPYLIDAVESVMTADLFNPETGRKSRSFILGGKLDIRATDKETGAKILFDHKTTSADISDFNAPYWRILSIEGQVSQYMLLEWLHQNKVDFGLWDVVRKPGISPKALSKADAKEVTETGKYFGWTLTDDDKEQFKVDSRETPLMYAARLAHDCTVERPEWYFQRRKTPRLDSEIMEYAQEVWGHGQDILATRQSGRWPRNSGACFTYNSACEYLGLCSGHDNLESGAWTTKHWVHPELPPMDLVTINSRGTEILTNSRIRCFQTCRRKHQLKYELGVEKIDAEEREVLFFGNLWHSAQEAYFLALQEAQCKSKTILSMT
jgi:hypothetical protein